MREVKKLTFAAAQSRRRAPASSAVDLAVGQRTRLGRLAARIDFTIVARAAQRIDVADANAFAIFACKRRHLN